MCGGFLTDYANFNRGPYNLRKFTITAQGKSIPNRDNCFAPIHHSFDDFDFY